MKVQGWRRECDLDDRPIPIRLLARVPLMGRSIRMLRRKAGAEASCFSPGHPPQIVSLRITDSDEKRELVTRHPDWMRWRSPLTESSSARQAKDRQRIASITEHSAVPSPDRAARVFTLIPNVRKMAPERQGVASVQLENGRRENSGKRVERLFRYGIWTR